MVRAYRPDCLEEAVRILSETGGIPLAGGTDLMVRHRRGPGVPFSFERPVVCVGGLKELTAVRRRNEGLVIGAGATLGMLLDQDDLPPALRCALGKIGSPGIRNSATLGGNICNASPAADSLPALSCLNASVEVLHGGRTSIYPIDDFITGPGTTILAPGGLLLNIIIPGGCPVHFFYRKIGARRANALSKLSFLGMHTVKDGTVTDIRMAFGAVAPKVVRLKGVEKNCIGRTPEELHADAAAIVGLYAKEIRPIDDQRSTAGYRKRTALRLLEHYLSKELM